MRDVGTGPFPAGRGRQESERGAGAGGHRCRAATHHAGRRPARGPGTGARAGGRRDLADRCAGARQLGHGRICLRRPRLAPGRPHAAALGGHADGRRALRRHGGNGRLPAHHDRRGHADGPGHRGAAGTVPVRRVAGACRSRGDPGRGEPPSPRGGPGRRPASQSTKCRASAPKSPDPCGPGREVGCSSMPLARGNLMARILRGRCRRARRAAVRGCGRAGRSSRRPWRRCGARSCGRRVAWCRARPPSRPAAV